MIHPLAGQKAPSSVLVDVAKLVSAYYTGSPDPAVASQAVAFGTSGHRGSSLHTAFNEAHLLAIAQAVVEWRKAHGIDGPMYVGRDTHALSEPAHTTVLEVLVGNDVQVCVSTAGAPTPTPAVSFAILEHNRGRSAGRADGLVLTPSHNPPEDGGIKYNPSNGGPSDTDVSAAIEKRANEILRAGNRDVRRGATGHSANVRAHDYVTPYVAALAEVVDMQAIAQAGLKIGVDPLGGAGIGFWAPIRERYGLDIEVVNDVVDPTFSFMTLDRDGRIRMDCSSPWAMASLVALKDRFDIAFGNDTDYDRHGIVAPSVGLLNPNHYLAVAIEYLFSNRPGWAANAMVGKTLVSSSMIDRVVASLGRKLCEVPVGFKWFVDGLGDGRFAFGGEESAGATFVRKDGSVWTTDKDGIILDLLAAEITAKTGRDPGECYRAQVARFGEPVYERIDARASTAQKAVLKKLSPEQVTTRELAGDPITATLTRAPGNDAPIGGLKVVTEHGWFAARPSGTEDVYKIYTESFRGTDHLQRIQQEAQAIVSAAFAAAGV